MVKERKFYTKQELTRTLNDAGYAQNIVNLAGGAKSSVLQGELCFKELASGIQIHCSDVTETRLGSSTSEIEACISINFLLEGCVDFALGDKKYHQCAQQHPVVFINVINRNQLFTRYFSQGQNVKKLNLTFKKGWLNKRCLSSTDHSFVEFLFSKPHRVYQWQCSPKMLNSAELMFSLQNSKSLNESFQVEALAMQLVNDCYSMLMTTAQTLTNSPIAKDSSTLAHEHNYEEKIASLLHQSYSLNELAQQLGASISTLQRYFKAKHHLTVKEYIRNQKLENARRSLLFDRITIGEASYFAGYSHVSNFVTAFKKYFAVTPAELQKQYLTPR